MIPISSTENAPLEFSSQNESVKYRMPTSKIGWLHSVSDNPGASFDVQIKDATGRVKWEKKDCKSETEKFGILANIPTKLGEDLEVCVSNIRGAKKLKVFMN